MVAHAGGKGRRRDGSSATGIGASEGGARGAG
jgi:hypothetical protein